MSTTLALEEHGYFKVLKTLITEPDQVRQERISKWRIKTQQEHDKWFAGLDPNIKIERTDYSNITPRLAYPYVLVAKRQE